MNPLERQLLALCERLDLQPPLDYDPIWSAAPDFLGLLVDHCLSHKPRVIVECSSGISTLMLAAACRLNGHGQVFSLENGAEFAQRTRQQLQRQGLSPQAQVLDAPLQPLVLNQTNFVWYDLSALPQLPLDMLVIDGPPGLLQPLSRYPALPLLFERLNAGASLFLDDAARADEQEIVRLWLEQFPQLQRKDIPSERGCVRLSL
ncbi:MAG: class I SAM-dependent methyltransferase [Gammaproteobacteria bacterium]|nr:class I SAM-dependent methyltransferase [Gammaproteobacteria bacterium]